ncbi:MAG: hypothetical protein CMO77_08310 [Verrucomicrobiales bacterium]|nr:hypothetical protein [Verrucomicrobiales bacterium]|tara:strand:+ start:355 stop:1095 length:741 start_codon:yes stop_codon:yes gene_type:complete
MINRPHFAGKSNKAFSLLELLLVLVIVMILFGAAVFEFNSINRGALLYEGSNQLKSLFRFASNEAQRTGKTIRIRFDNPEKANNEPLDQLDNTVKVNYPTVEWEPNPLKLPGQYKILPNSQNYSQDIDQLVIIESIQLTGLDEKITLSAVKPLDEQSGETDSETTQPFEYSTPILHFYQDGSCDSAKIQLSSRNPENLNKSVVELIGFTGTVRHQIIEISPDQSNNIESKSTTKEEIENDQSPTGP